MVVTVNGERRDLPADLTVSALLETLGYEGGFYAVAVNEALVRRTTWRTTAVAEGDRVEVVTPRQGG